MRIAPILATLALAASSLAAHASDITFNVSGGTFNAPGSFSGMYAINSSTYIVDSGTFLVSGGGLSNVTFTGTTDSAIPGVLILSDGAAGDVFALLLGGLIPNETINTVTSCPFNCETQLQVKGGALLYATAGTVTPTPEPSSLMLLGTGVLGFAGVVRRRFNA